jgi:hypothetical protein
MVPFIYGLDGRIFEIQPPFHGFREPSVPVPAEITALTGITNEMLAGKSIDPAEVAAFATDSALVVAHNAEFDRRFLERLSDTFLTPPWACSMTQIDWATEGYEGTKLAYPNGPGDVRSLIWESSLTRDHRTLDGYGNFGWVTSPNGRCCRASPLPIEWTGVARSASITELRQKQHLNNRSDKQALHFQITFQKPQFCAGK